MPALNGYTEEVSLPPYASTELRADSLGLIPGSGTVITGNVTWNNVAGANAAVAALVSLHNLSFTGGFTVTDDVNAPSSFVAFGGDESGTSVSLASFDSHTTTKLVQATFLNASIGGILAGTADTNADVVLHNSTCSTVLTANGLQAFESNLSCDNISINANNTAAFFDCRFAVGTTTTLTSLGGSVFDGPSWQSFVESGGIRAVGTTVLVEGGYSGAGVDGAALPTTGTNTNVSLNGTGATAGYTGEHSGNHYSSLGLAADGASVTIKNGGGEREGDTILITKKDLVAHALAVKDTNSTLIATIPSGSRGFVLAQFTGGAWVLAQCGALAA
jgi:hypothetical protein